VLVDVVENEEGEELGGGAVKAEGEEEGTKEEGGEDVKRCVGISAIECGSIDGSQTLYGGMAISEV
jgi:hypothetical protein